MIRSSESDAGLGTHALVGVATLTISALHVPVVVLAAVMSGPIAGVALLILGPLAVASLVGWLFVADLRCNRWCVAFAWLAPFAGHVYVGSRTQSNAPVALAAWGALSAAAIVISAHIFRACRRSPERCATCEYDLSGLRTRICPECGALNNVAPLPRAPERETP